MKIKKVRKSKKLRGSHTHARGFKKKARGSGHRGGVGKAGTGKRGDQKKLLKKGEPYFKKRQVLGKAKIIKLKTMSLNRLVEGLESYIKRGIVKEEKGIYLVKLKRHKLVGKVEDLKLKFNIEIDAVSAGAKESVEGAGGAVVLVGKGSGKF